MENLLAQSENKDELSHLNSIIESIEAILESTDNTADVTDETAHSNLNDSSISPLADEKSSHSSSLVESSSTLPDLPQFSTFPAFKPFIPAAESSISTPAAESSIPTPLECDIETGYPEKELHAIVDKSESVHSEGILPIEPTIILDKELPKPSLEISLSPEMNIFEPSLGLTPSSETTPPIKELSFLEKMHAAYKKLKTDPDSILFIKVNPTFMSIFGILLENNPILFDNIEKNIKLILEDGKLSVKDIPRMIDLLKHVYAAIKRLNLKEVSAEVYGQIAIDLVYSIFVICLSEEIIKLNKPKESVGELLVILESCRDLIEMTIEQKQWWMLCGC